MTEEELKETGKSLLVAIRRFRLALIQHHNFVLGPEGLTLPQFTVLSLLERHGEMTMGQLSGRLGTAMGAATNLVDRLIHSKHVTRQHSTTDRRVVNVALTEKGAQLMDRRVSNGVKTMVEFLQTLDPGKRVDFVESYHKLGEFMREISSEETGVSISPESS